MKKGFEIYKTKEFENDFKKLDKSLKDQIEKEVNQLKENPYVGKSLGYKIAYPLLQE